MIEIRILELANYWSDLELYENDPVNLKFQYTDVENIQRPNSSFSQSFRIPATEKNINVFGQLFDVNYEGSFNVKKRTKAILSVDTIPTIRGFIQLKNVYIQKGKYSDFEIVFFGEGADFSKALVNKKLSDLDLSAYDHEVNLTNLQSSWAGTLFSGKVRYSIIDKGANWSASIPSIYPSEFTPNIRTYELLKAIFEQSGFTLISDFFASQTNLYTPLSNKGRFVSIDLPYDNIRFLAHLDSDLNITAQGLVTPTFTEDYDPSSVIVGNLFSPPYNGQYQIRVRTTVTNNGSNPAEFNVLLRNVTDGVTVLSFNTNYTLAAGQTFTNFALQTVTLDSTKQYAVAYFVQGTAVDVTFQSGTFPTNGTYWKLEIAYPPLYGQTASLATNAPNITQIEFIRSLQACYNLVFIPDRLNENIITVEPFEDYTSTGDIKDWTEKLVHDKDVVISPTTDLQSKKYEWTYTADKDDLNQIYITQAARTYGRYLIEDDENEFSVGEKVIKSGFGSYPCTYIQGSNLLIYKQTAAGEVIDPLCKLVYWGGMVEGELSVVDSSVHALTTYPYFNHYSTVDVDFEDVDLNFGGEIPAFPIIANPYGNLYRYYWMNYVTQLYSSSSRIMTGYFNLSLLDVANFKFGDQIFIKDTYWRILEVDYSPNSNDLTKVKLIKLITGANICDLTPVSAGQSGVINFVDADGAPATPTEVCCTFYNYTWTGSSCVQGLSDFTFGFGIDVNADNALALGQQIEGGEMSLLLGNNIAALQRSIAVGQNINTPFDNSFSFGNGVVGFAQGHHLGGGYWHEKYLKGENQTGTIIFIYEGDFDSGDEVELFIGGVDGNRLVIPNNSSLNVEMTVNITTIHTATQRVEDVQYLVFHDIFKKIGGTSSSYQGAHANVADIRIGDFSMGSSVFHTDIDTTTDTTQHRIMMHNNSETNTSQTRIICIMKYTMAII